MTTRLTLTVDESLAAKAKLLAMRSNKSLPEIVIRALEREVQQAELGRQKEQYAPAVRSLIGILDLPASYDWEDEYYQHMLKKHG